MASCTDWIWRKNGFPKLKFIACVFTMRSFSPRPVMSMRLIPVAFGVRSIGSRSTDGRMARIFCLYLDPVRTPVSVPLRMEKLLKKSQLKSLRFFQMVVQVSESTASWIITISNSLRRLWISYLSFFERHLWTFHTHRRNEFPIDSISFTQNVKILFLFMAFSVAEFYFFCNPFWIFIYFVYNNLCSWHLI